MFRILVCFNTKYYWIQEFCQPLSNGGVTPKFSKTDNFNFFLPLEFYVNSA